MREALRLFEATEERRKKKFEDELDDSKRREEIAKKLREH